MITASNSVFVTNNGKQAVQCNKSKDILGLGKNVTQVNRPKELRALHNKGIIKLCSSHEHVLALSAQGQLWSWGYNDDGKLGLGHRQNQFSPTKIPFRNSITNIVCGRWSSFALTDNGKVFGWGYNKGGQLGLDKRYQVWTRPVLINTLPEKIVQLEVSVMLYYALALSDTGNVYGFGYCCDEKPRRLLFGKSNNTRAVQVSGTWKAGFILTDQGEIYWKPDCQKFKPFFRSKDYFISKIYVEQSRDMILVIGVTNKREFILWRNAYVAPHLYDVLHEPTITVADLIAITTNCSFLNYMLKPNIHHHKNDAIFSRSVSLNQLDKIYMQRHHQFVRIQQICFFDKQYCFAHTNFIVWCSIAFNILILFFVIYMIKNCLKSAYRFFTKKLAETHEKRSLKPPPPPIELQTKSYE